MSLLVMNRCLCDTSAWCVLDLQMFVQLVMWKCLFSKLKQLWWAPETRSRATRSHVESCLYIIVLLRICQVLRLYIKQQELDTVLLSRKQNCKHDGLDGEGGCFHTEHS